MKRKNIIIGVLALLILLVVVVSWPSSDSEKTSTSTYQGNGVSFNYPSDYVITEAKQSNGRFLNGSSDTKTFEISKKSIDEDLETFFTETKQLLADANAAGQYTSISNETQLTVDGAKAYQITYSMVIAGETKHHTYTVFDKNGSRYVVLFVNDYYGLDSKVVLDSFKVT